MPYETSRYVPSFFATMYVLEYANEHGIALYKEGTTKNKMDTIHVKEQIAFSHIAKFLSEKKIFEVIKYLTTKNKKIWIDPSNTPYAIVNNKNTNSSLFIKKNLPN